MICVWAAPPTCVSRGLRAYQGVYAHTQGLTCERTMWLSGRYHPGQAPDNVLEQPIPPGTAQNADHFAVGSPFSVFFTEVVCVLGATLPRTAAAPAVWRAPEGPEGTGGLRGGAWLRRPWAAAGPGRGSRRRAERSSRRGRLAGGPPPTAQPGPRDRPHDARNTRGATSNPAQPKNARRSSPSEPCARAGASRPGRSGCGPRCAAPRLRCR